MARGRAKREKEEQKLERKLIYELMQKAAKELWDDQDILNMVYCHGGYFLKFIAEGAPRGKYSLYGCDNESRHSSKQFLLTGTADEIAVYLNDEANIDEVFNAVKK
ncbi:MAG: hypothetical protein IKU60_02530 [Clostridia bacterium]|nr:hypothetical protein [Clostridia bacterium]